MNLRGYQSKAISDLRDGLAKGIKRQVLTVPTGGGKTRIAAGIIENAVAKGKRVAFICNRIELVLQAFEAFRKLGLGVGIIQGENSCHTSAQVLCCSIQTIAKRGFPDADLYIIDECHTSAASKEFHSLFFSRNNIPIIGLTATPFAKGMAKHHDALKGPLYERLVVGATIPELIDGEFLVDCEIYAPSEPDLSGVKIVAGDYQENQLGDAVNKPKLIGDIVTHWEKLANGKKTIVFATNISHSQHIVEQFNASGHRAKHLDAYTEADERREIINGFKRGDFEIISNCSLLSEGFDCPETECIILARPTRSLIRYIQMAGRALRPFHGKDKATILDHSGTVKLLGFPTDDLPMVLDDGKTKAKEEKPPILKICKSCYAVKKPGQKKCPVCGFEPVITPAEVAQEEGELVKMVKKRTMKTADKQAIYSALLTIQANKGYQSGWVSNKYREIVGVWPRGLEEMRGPVIEIVEKHMTHARIKWAAEMKKNKEMNEKRGAA